MSSSWSSSSSSTSSSASKRGDVLFELPIGGTGNIVVSQPAAKVYLVTFRDGADNRLTTAFCQAVILALDIIEQRHEPGVVITTSGIEKFYSNGLDLQHATYTPGFWKDSLYALWLRLITYSMPTVALLNGHAFAGGFMVAMMHDYRIMNPHKGYLCLNELELGVPLRPPMMSVFRQKVSAAAFKRMVLEAHRYKALEALNEGIVDWLGGLDEALAHIEEFRLAQKAQKAASGGRIYGVLKNEMYRETVDYLQSSTEESIRWSAQTLQLQREKKQREERVKRWEQGRAKFDYKVRCHGQDFRVHKIILHCHSSYFKGMFTGSNLEPNANEDPNPRDDDPAVMKAMFDFFYTDTYDVPDSESPLTFHLKVFKMADYYQAPALEASQRLYNGCAGSRWNVKDFVKMVRELNEVSELSKFQSLVNITMKAMKHARRRLSDAAEFQKMLSELRCWDIRFMGMLFDIEETKEALWPSSSASSASPESTPTPPGDIMRREEEDRAARR
ncbi:hypothetical protein LTR37_020032 [Vermiconidia calcicola]|uniref:Uncharacterized protein n=1 Tax=Vermiconidia calcicola TaxID=1690605 RepID=A0ACC3MDM2_9PEZI|nr:hypothetical protein LTR37_020032 [Vermiconidia calcicola]